MSKYKDLYKLEPGHYFLRIDPYNPRVCSNSERLRQKENFSNIIHELWEKGISISVIEAHKGTIEFIPKPKSTKEKLP